MTPAAQRARAAAQEVLDLHSSIISTHYEGCWHRHVACFASLVKDILEEES